MLKKRIAMVGLLLFSLPLSSCGNTTKYVTTDDFVFEVRKDGLVLMNYYEEYPVDVVIPEEVDGKTVIGITGMLYTSNKLKGVKTLETISIPDTVKSIGSFCFYDCTNLRSCNIPASLKTIDYSVFKYTGLENVVIPEGVKKIDRSAFSCCYSLEYVVLPKSIESIGTDAFLYNNSLENIYYAGTIEDYNKIRFGYKDIDEKNNITIDDVVSFYSESEPIDSGSYWHYVDSKPCKW